MVNPWLIIGGLIAGANKLQELCDKKKENDTNCTDEMNTFKSNLKTLESLKEQLENDQSMILNHEQNETWTEKSNSISELLKEFNTWVSKRDGQWRIRKLLCSACQSDKIRRFVRRFSNGCDDIHKFLVGMVNCGKLRYLQQIAGNTQKIVENTKQTAENTEQTAENTQQTAENTQQTAENTQQIVKNTVIITLPFQI
jgi:methyl-accepting chemotaxis protein